MLPEILLTFEAALGHAACTDERVAISTVESAFPMDLCHGNTDSNFLSSRAQPFTIRRYVLRANFFLRVPASAAGDPLWFSRQRVASAYWPSATVPGSSWPNQVQSFVCIDASRLPAYYVSRIIEIGRKCFQRRGMHVTRQVYSCVVRGI